MMPSGALIARAAARAGFDGSAEGGISHAQIQSDAL